MDKPVFSESTLLGDPARDTPQPSDRTAVSFGSTTGGVPGEPTTSPADPYATEPERWNAARELGRDLPATCCSRFGATGRVKAGGTDGQFAVAAVSGASRRAAHARARYANLQIPPFYTEKLFAPLPGTQTRGVGISEWESYRTDVAGKDILVTTDDSNFYRDRNGKLNGNTGDTDASGLNVTDATDSMIYGSESADEAPFQTVARHSSTSSPRTHPTTPPEMTTAPKTMTTATPICPIRVPIPRTRR